jgi:hypothetical protein
VGQHIQIPQHTRPAARNNSDSTVEDLLHGTDTIDVLHQAGRSAVCVSTPLVLTNTACSGLQPHQCKADTIPESVPAPPTGLLHADHAYCSAPGCGIPSLLSPSGLLSLRPLAHLGGMLCLVLRFLQRNELRDAAQERPANTHATRTAPAAARARRRSPLSRTLQRPADHPRRRCRSRLLLLSCRRLRPRLCCCCSVAVLGRRRRCCCGACSCCGG